MGSQPVHTASALETKHKAPISQQFLKYFSNSPAGMKANTATAAGVFLQGSPECIFAQTKLTSPGTATFSAGTWGTPGPVPLTQKTLLPLSPASPA